MADSETQQPVDSTQQVTSAVPVTAPVIKQKNPRRVAASKAIAQKARLAREAQKQKAAEADIIIAKNQLKKAEAAADPPAADPPTADEPPAKNLLTTTQWLSVISIIVSVVRIYYKREEIKNVLTKNPPQAPLPVYVAPQRKGGIRQMD